jgi:hypothetical protein
VGQVVATAGDIAGDVIAAGSDLRLAGRIGGDVRAIGDAVQVLGAVERNVLVAARRLQLQPGATVKGSWTGWAEEAFVSGSIGRALWLASASARLDAAVDGAGSVMADRVTLGAAARFPGGLEYWSPSDRHEPSPSREVARARELLAGAGRLLTLALLVSSLVAALLVGALAPGAGPAIAHALTARPWRALLLGLAVLVLPLPVALLLGLTVIGLPLAVSLLGVWAVTLGLGWVLSAGAAGSLLGQRHAVAAAVGGAALLWLIGQLPLVGTALAIAAAGIGGALLLSLLRRARLAA